MSKWSSSVANEWVAARCSSNTCVAVRLDTESNSASIRDTKQDDLGESANRPTISMNLDDWDRFTQVVAGEPLDATSPVEIVRADDGSIELRASATRLAFDAAEWSAFVADVECGRFRLTLTA